MNGETVTMKMIYSKLDKVDKRLEEIECLVLPRVKLSKKEMNEIEEARQDIQKGNYITLKQLINEQ